ncbi:hypothetical protein Tco_0988534 [Tanacetum coccineum]|uniref:Uncharacterized protein n=1 Tax=Tanacetum coccineum TaxID=301880 RepID=A0ABQ5ERC9_9ASTR
MSGIDDDLFTYEVEISGLANVPCDLNEEDDSEKQMTHGSGDGMEYDPSNVEFTKWLALKFYNHKTMDHYTKNALWIYWARGNDEVELTDKESSNSDDEDEVAEIFRINTNLVFIRGMIFEMVFELRRLSQQVGEDGTTLRIPTVIMKKESMRWNMKMMYSFGEDEEYVAIKENKYNDLTSTVEEACV